MGDHALKNVYSHLTNTSINKSSPTLGDQKEELGAGCRWKVAKLRAHFQERGLDFETIWNR